MKFLFNVFLLIQVSAVCFISATANAQEVGMKFESGIRWEEILAKAKAEHKLIFLDCYATWCGPCKYMDQQIYPNKEVGDYFDAHFIGVKLQMDKTKDDPQDIRNWYAKADSIAKQYQIDAYPTFLFLSPEGKALNRLVGLIRTPKDFISKLEVAQNPEMQYYNVLGNKDKRLDDSAFLLHATMAAMDANDQDNARRFANDYLDLIKDPVTKDNLHLISDYVRSESDKGFKIFLSNTKKIDAISRENDFAEDHLTDIIFKEEVKPLLNQNSYIDIKDITQALLEKYSMLDVEKFSSKLDGAFMSTIVGEIFKMAKSEPGVITEWTQISNRLSQRFPDYDCDRVLLYAKARYYYGKQSWENCVSASIELLDRYNKQLASGTTNDIAWMCIFQHGKDTAILKKAVGFMKQVINDTPNNAAFLDTYANLLYKTGHTREAIECEEKANRLSQINDGAVDEEIQKTLEKMKSGQPTWQVNDARS